MLRHSFFAPRLASAVLAGSLAGIVACSDSTAPVQMVGVYDLVSINGLSLPYVFDSSATHSYATTATRLTLSSKGASDVAASWVMVRSSSYLDSSVRTDSQVVTAGTWSQKRSIVTLSQPGSTGALMATLSGDTLTVTIACNGWECLATLFRGTLTFKKS